MIQTFLELQVMFGDSLDHHNLYKEVLLTSNKQGPRILLNKHPAKHKTATTQRIIGPQMSIVPKVKNLIQRLGQIIPFFLSPPLSFPSHPFPVGLMSQAHFVHFLLSTWNVISLRISFFLIQNGAKSTQFGCYGSSLLLSCHCRHFQQTEPGNIF